MRLYGKGGKIWQINESSLKGALSGRVIERGPIKKTTRLVCEPKKREIHGDVMVHIYTYTYIHTNIRIYYSAHSPWGFSVADYMKYLPILSLTIYIYSFPHHFPNY